MNYGALNRYDDVHRTTNFNNFRSNNRVVTQPPVGTYNRVVTQPPVQPYRAPVQPYRAPVANKIIIRNIDTTNPRINDFRGHAAAAARCRSTCLWRRRSTPFEAFLTRV